MSQHIIKVQNIECGTKPLFLIAGPCVIEAEKIMMETAEKLKLLSQKLNLNIIFKSSFQKDNRSSVAYYSGPGIDEGMRILEKIKNDFQLPILTDIHYPHQASIVAEVVDIIQIPAYLIMQTELLLSAAGTQKVINLKHGQFLAPENMIKPVEKVLSVGNKQILLTERGYTFGYNDLVVDPRSFYWMNRIGFPVIFDITHSIRKYGIPSADPRGGAKEFLSTLARSGVAAGVDGIFIETHPQPSEALCDAASQLDIKHMEKFIAPLIEIHEIEHKHRNSNDY